MCLFLEGALWFSRPMHGLENDSARRRAPRGSSSGSRMLAGTRNIASNASPAGSVRRPRQDKTSEMTNEKEELEAFLRGETHLRLRSRIKTQPTTT